MANVFERFGKIVKSEWNHRVHHDDDIGGKPAKEDLEEAERALGRQATATTSATMTKPMRTPAVADVDGALRVLELQPPVPTLDVVRARYRELARHYHPKTQSTKSDDAHAAHVVLEALADALEILEEHLLPLPPSAQSQSSQSSRA